MVCVRLVRCAICLHISKGHALHLIDQRTLYHKYSLQWKGCWWSTSNQVERLMSSILVRLCNISHQGERLMIRVLGSAAIGKFRVHPRTREESTQLDLFTGLTLHAQGSCFLVKLLKRTASSNDSCIGASLCETMLFTALSRFTVICGRLMLQ